MAKGDVQLRGAIQSDVCSAPPPPGWVVANATLQQVCITHRNRYRPGTQPAGFFSQLNARNHAKAALHLLRKVHCTAMVNQLPGQLDFVHPDTCLH